MKQADVVSLYRFHMNANQTVLETAARLDADAFNRESSPSHGSIRKLILHILGGDMYFPPLCAGRLPDMDALQAIESLETLDAIRQQWDAAHEAALATLDSLDDDDMLRTITITFGEHSFRLAVWQVFVQVIAHAHMHRGELSILLSEAGHPLPTIDLMVHFIESSGQHWPF